MKSLRRTIWEWLLCWADCHDWTSAVLEGIEPTDAQLGSMNTITNSGFWDYAKLYCKRCGKVSWLAQIEIDAAAEREVAAVIEGSETDVSN